MNVSLLFEGHNVAYQCKGLDQSNISRQSLLGNLKEAYPRSILTNLILKKYL